MSENKTPNLPLHLQEKMTDAAYSYEAPRHFNCYGCCQSDSDYEKSFESGYLQAYSDIMQELGPVVEALEDVLKLKPRWDDNGEFYKPSDVATVKIKSLKSIKHLKERILNEKT